MNNQYKITIRACFTGYIVQAIINNFAPLLFLTFHGQYGIPLSQITILISVNFALQLLIDFLSAFFVDKIGYRVAMLLAHGFTVVGFGLLAFLPEAMSNPFVGLLIAVCFYAVGGGLLEVVVSPIVEACPSDHKQQNMSLLHSFYCWGSVGVVALSTLYFTLFGTERWRILALLWASVPFMNGILFLRVPIATLLPEGEKSLSVVQLLKNKLFWLFLLLMFCAGASEQAVSQWASTFVEQGLGVTKTIGDLAGPCMFSILMGISRLFFGKYGNRMNLERMMFISGLLCVFSYLLIGFTATPVFGLLGIALCGFSVGILWPGTFSKASESIKRGGTAMFAILALAGDLGCSGGPTFVGLMAARLSDDLRKGILWAAVIPIVLLLLLLLLRTYRKRHI